MNYSRGPGWLDRLYDGYALTMLLTQMTTTTTTTTMATSRMTLQFASKLGQKFMAPHTRTANGTRTRTRIRPTGNSVRKVYFFSKKNRKPTAKKGKIVAKVFELRVNVSSTLFDSFCATKLASLFPNRNFLATLLS